MRTFLAMLVLALVPSLAAPDTNLGGKVIECYCTDTYGERVELGESTCLFVDGRSFIARCEMSLNNPIWRDTGVECTTSRLLPIESEADHG